MQISRALVSSLIVLSIAAATLRAVEPATTPASGPTTAAASPIPAGEAQALARLNASPRHGEWVDIQLPNSKTPLKAYVVYPERKDKAPIVLVVQEIFGLTDWLRNVADQFAADGFIAVAPDFLSGKGPNNGGTEAFPSRDAVTRAVSGLNHDDVLAQLNVARDYALKLPSASGKSASVGFCWGGGISFAYAATQPALDAAVVYYGTPPKDSDLPNIHAPIAAFYGGSDNRVTSTLQPVEDKLKKLDKTYLPHIYDNAGHGFLRAQDQRDGANLKAAQQAWPATIEFLRKHLEPTP